MPAAKGSARTPLGPIPKIVAYLSLLCWSRALRSDQSWPPLFLPAAQGSAHAPLRLIMDLGLQTIGLALVLHFCMLMNLPQTLFFEVCHWWVCSSSLNSRVESKSCTLAFTLLHLFISIFGSGMSREPYKSFDHSLLCSFAPNFESYDWSKWFVQLLWLVDNTKTNLAAGSCTVQYKQMMIWTRSAHFCSAWPKSILPNK